MSKLLLLGAGGFGRCVAELAGLTGEWDTVCFLDDHAVGADILGALAQYERFAPDFDGIFPAFGENELRLFWVKRLLGEGYSVPVLLHPAAYLSPSAHLGAGCVLLPGAVVHTGATAGSAVLFNCNAVVDHDCAIGEGAHICIGALVKAGCIIAPLSKIEAGQVIMRPI